MTSTQAATSSVVNPFAVKDNTISSIPFTGVGAR